MGGAATVPVEGKVTLNGQPLSGASVVFSQTRPTSPGPYIGQTDSQGNFKLGLANSTESGAAPGEYLVVITTVKQDPGAMEDSPVPTQKEVVPAAYRDGSTRTTVPEGGKKSVNFDMKSR